MSIDLNYLEAASKGKTATVYIGLEQALRESSALAVANAVSRHFSPIEEKRENSPQHDINPFPEGFFADINGKPTCTSNLPIDRCGEPENIQNDSKKNSDLVVPLEYPEQIEGLPQATAEVLIGLAELEEDTDATTPIPPTVVELPTITEIPQMTSTRSSVLILGVPKSIIGEV